MAEDWTLEEVERTVEVYFTMLGLELGGERYSKTEFRRQLRADLGNRRTEASFEFKFQNISAVLQDLGSETVDGYKPARNVQQLLREQVAEQYEKNHELRQAMLRAATEPASQGSVLSDPVDTPELIVPDTGFTPRAAMIDFAAVEAANRSLGLAGEHAVVDYERAVLCRGGRDDLAERVEHVSRTRGDGLGYDVLSFSGETGQERYLEVKTTRSSRYRPFLLTRNELAASEEWGEAFVLCRLFRFSETSAQQYRIVGPLGTGLELVPSTYLVYPHRGRSGRAS
ncbi:DUF3883 domain-containing protein [Naumannella halotolerans]|uniref:Uncharacterized protein DUF3883 n=1 Tax=Naumannella halotolerans TaxID=993414 RepID=A0A4R7J7W4_9ACTN|nr:DUF3883 domain-containing protein [Naumannella halotolerans]TDT33560.1 uncharacterized protein DUF3883 [Naumannella halotolerans]